MSSRREDTDAGGWRRFSEDRTLQAVLAVTVAAVLVRLVDLGARVAHWDEGRVAWWIVHYVETGTHEYRAIVHGPFLPIVNGPIFEAIGATDFSMRLVVAVVGGLAPAVALLFRERLRDAEVLALAALLAANPILLYYSRFMRNDVLVAVFLLAALGAFVRLVDSGRTGYLYAGVAFLALGLTAKENALIYIVCWIGALGLLLDHRLFRSGPRHAGRIAGGHARRVIGAAWRYKLPLFLAFLEAFLILLFFYAPRSGSAGALALDNVVTSPGILPALLEETFLGSWDKLVGQWGGAQENPYLEFLAHFLETMAAGAIAVSALAVFGFLLDRYDDGGPRDLVALGGYWGFVSVLGYPLGTDIKAPWIVVHAIVPLAIPAAVGLAYVCRETRDAYESHDRPAVVGGVVILLLVSGAVLAPAWEANVVQPTDRDNQLVQYAQPAGDVKPTLKEMARLSESNQGTDVLFVGEKLVDGDTEARRHPPCIKWFDALPMPWYLEKDDVSVECAMNATSLETTPGERPPVVITRGSETSAVDAALGSGYRSETYEMRLWGTETTFFVRRS
jgi:uncharacterized protein (TIGR03663 family)